MSHGALADVAVHAVPSELTEDDLKVTATLKDGIALNRRNCSRGVWNAFPILFSLATSSSAPNYLVARWAGFSSVICARKG